MLHTGVCVYTWPLFYLHCISNVRTYMSNGFCPRPSPQDDFFLKWDTCYWILRETLLLEGYKTNSKSSKDMVKTINLNHCENISVCDFTGKREYVFKLSVYVKGRTKEYLFNAKSEKERDLWVSAIVNVCDLDPG